MPPFFDTNILIYSVDRGETVESGPAGELVETHLVRGNGAISVQVLREFYSAVRRWPQPLSNRAAATAVRRLAGFSPLSEDVGLVLKAVRRSQEMSISLSGTP